MTRRRTSRLWDDIRSISETQQGHQALTTTGALIAGTYFGYVGPELFGTMHDALGFYAAKYPFLDPQGMATSLWNGAKYFSASALDYVSDISDRFAIELTQNVREAGAAARDYLSRGGARGLEAARIAFEETAHFVEGSSRDLVDTVTQAAKSGWDFVKTNWGAIMAFGAAAKEAYDYYETGESIYHRLTGRTKAEAAAKDATEAEINVAANTAIAGAEALEAADAELAGQASGSGQVMHLDVDIDQVVWVSDQLHRRLDAASADMRPDPSAELPIGRIGAGTTRFDIDRLMKSPDFNVDEAALKRIDLAAPGFANKLRCEWDDSPASGERLAVLRGQVRKTAQTEFDISDPLAFERGRRKTSRDRAEHVASPGHDIIQDRSPGCTCSGPM